MRLKSNIGLSLSESPRVKSTKEREIFAKHMLCKSQKANFHFLIIGFCRRFSTPVSKCSLSTDKPNRKAAFSVARIKMLANFQTEKATQERSIIKRFFLGQSEGQFSPEVVYAVLSVIYEMVYFTIHSHVQRKNPYRPSN